VATLVWFGMVDKELNTIQNLRVLNVSPRYIHLEIFISLYFLLLGKIFTLPS